LDPDPKLAFYLNKIIKKKEIDIYDRKKTHFRIQNSAESGSRIRKDKKLFAGSGY
jgi:hypothetical protein